MTEASTVPMFARFLGPDFETLGPALRAGHDVQDSLSLAGRARVTRGKSLWARFLARVFGFPPAADDVPVFVVMTAQNGGEMWERRFGDARFRSFLKVQNGAMTERFAPFTFRLGLHVKDAQVFYPVAAGRLGVIPLPRWCLPLSVAREYEAEGKFHFDVALRAPFTGALMVHYQGWLTPARPIAPDSRAP